MTPRRHEVPARTGSGRRVRSRCRLSSKCGPSRQHLKCHAPERPDVSAFVYAIAARLLGAHVGGRPQDQPVGLAFVRSCLGQTEVENLGRSVPADLDIGGLQVAMHDAALMCGVEALADLAGYSCGVVERDRSPANALGQRLAVHQFEDEASDTVRLVDAVDRRDVRMTERSEEPCFLLESRQALGIVAEGFRQDLDRDIATKDGVADAVDVAHATGPQQRIHPVRPEHSSGEVRNLVGHEPSRGRERGLFEERRGGGVLGEQRFDLGLQRRILAACAIEKGDSIRICERRGLVIEAIDLGPAVSVHPPGLFEARAAATP